MKGCKLMVTRVFAHDRYGALEFYTKALGLGGFRAFEGPSGDTVLPEMSEAERVPETVMEDLRKPHAPATASYRRQ